VSLSGHYLIFADDVVLGSKSPEELQILLNILERYLAKKKLVWNNIKTEIKVFKGTNNMNGEQKTKCFY
jgi:glycine betaine/choline ABC-type transport system substrate-binding protein